MILVPCELQERFGFYVASTSQSCELTESFDFSLISGV